MSRRPPSDAGAAGLIGTGPGRRSTWSVAAEVHRKDATFRFLSEFAGLSLIVLVATGPFAPLFQAPSGVRTRPVAPSAADAAPPGAPAEPREIRLAPVADALAPNPEAAPTPDLYRLGPGAVVGAPSGAEGNIYLAIELLRRRAPAPSILAVVEGLDPAEPNTALVRGLATIARGGRGDAAAGVADLRRAAEAGHVAAAALYGLALLDPPASLERRPAEGRQWLRKAADAGDHGAQYVLGYAYLSGWAGVADPVAAASLIKAAADGGRVDAMKLLAGLYLTGRGVAKDVDACERYLRTAMESGDADAEGLYGDYLVTMSLTGWGPSLDEGAAWLRKAAEAGDAKAMHTLGMVQVEYAKAPPLRDLKAGVDWFERCAALGNPDCEFALGRAYAEGLGRARDLPLAARNYAAAGRAGSRRGWTELARVNAELATMGLSQEPGSPPDLGSWTGAPAAPRVPTFSGAAKNGAGN